MTDIYPVGSKDGTTMFTRKNIFIAALIIALIWLATCHYNNKQVTPRPVVITSKELVKDTIALAKLRYHLTDSFSIEGRKHDEQNYRNESDLNKLLAENELLADINTRLQNEIYPDTCKEIVKKYQDNYNIYVSQTKKTLDKSNRTISGLNATVKTQKDYLAAKDKITTKYITLLDTCTKSLGAMEKYAKSVSPKREISAGINMISGYAFPLKPEFGLELSYRNRNAFEISVGYYTNQQISVGVKKRLVKF